MTVEEQLFQQINSYPEPKRSEMLALHELILHNLPVGKLWFEDGKDSNGKIVANPTIGYGSYIIQYANGKTKEFFKIGMSANTTGISIYLLGISDKNYLARTFGNEIGKASVTGYCIKFKTLKDIDIAVLEKAIQYRISYTD